MKVNQVYSQRMYSPWRNTLDMCLMCIYLRYFLFTLPICKHTDGLTLGLRIYSHTFGYSLVASDPGGSVIKNPPVNSGDADSISESGRSPREGNANLLQYSCLENSMNREACGPQPPGSQREGAHRHVASDVASECLPRDAIHPMVDTV